MRDGGPTHRGSSLGALSPLESPSAGMHGDTVRRCTLPVSLLRVRCAVRAASAQCDLTSATHFVADSLCVLCVCWLPLQLSPSALSALAPPAASFSSCCSAVTETLRLSSPGGVLAG